VLTLLVLHAKWAIVVPGAWKVRLLSFAQDVLVVVGARVGFLKVAVRPVNSSGQLKFEFIHTFFTQLYSKSTSVMCLLTPKPLNSVFSIFFFW
jgi:hypothetical protein